MNSDLLILLVILAIIGAALMPRKWRPSTSAFGVSRWADSRDLRRARMLGGTGLILGRGLRTGALIRLNEICHCLLVGGPGSGKGIGYLIPNLLCWRRSSIVSFDTKGDLYAITAHCRRSWRERIIRLAPWNDGEDGYNVLDDISRDNPLLIDRCKAVAAALVIRLGTEPDGHWLEKAEQIIGALIVLVCLRFEGAERSLNTVQHIASSPQLLASAAVKLCELGSIPERLGNHIAALFTPTAEGGLPELSKEGSSIMSTVGRFLGFLDSELVARAVAHSTFRPTDLINPGTTLYIQIPPDLLEAQRGLLRCWVSSLIREVTREGDETKGEVLFLLDEASSLGSLAALEEVLVRGRSAGCRVFLAYQADSQVRAAFRDKPTLMYETIPAQVYLCPPSGFETTERICKMLGDHTQVLESANTSESRNNQQQPGQHASSNVTYSTGYNWSVAGRNLLRPEEIMNLPSDRAILFVRGVGAPIICRRLSYFSDPLFGGRPPNRPLLILVLLIATLSLFGWLIWSNL